MKYHVYATLLNQDDKPFNWVRNGDAWEAQMGVTLVRTSDKTLVELDPLDKSMDWETVLVTEAELGPDNIATSLVIASGKPDVITHRLDVEATGISFWAE